MPVDKRVRDEMIEDIRLVTGVLQRVPTEREFSIHSLKFKGGCVTARFGSWNKALLASGINPTRVRKPAYSADMLISKLKEFAEETGHTPTTREWGLRDNVPSIVQYKRVFGTWTKAILAAGLKPTRYEKSIGDRGRMILQWLREFYKEHNYLPTVIELQSCKGSPSHYVIRAIFGSYSDAVRAAGFAPRLPGQNRKTYKGKRRGRNHA